MNKSAADIRKIFDELRTRFDAVDPFDAGVRFAVQEIEGVWLVQRQQLQDHIQKLRELEKDLSQFWKPTKLEICDFDNKESWIVKTIDPEAFSGFEYALDVFLTAFDKFTTDLKEGKLGVVAEET